MQVTSSGVCTGSPSAGAPGTGEMGNSGVGTGGLARGAGTGTVVDTRGTFQGRRERGQKPVSSGGQFLMSPDTVGIREVQTVAKSICQPCLHIFRKCLGNGSKKLGAYRCSLR
jgi:hypothetical protein